MTAIILAGGKAKRLGGRDKAFLKIGGKTLVDRQSKLLKKIFKRVIIVANSPDKYRNLKGVEIITDKIAHQGPLGGIYSGLLASEFLYNFVVACDMPFLNKSLIIYFIKNIDSRDIIVPKIDGRHHPLFGVYSKNCVPIIEDMLRQGELKISPVFSKVKTRFIAKREIEKFDRLKCSLMNINTKEDLVAARAVIASP